MNQTSWRYHRYQRDRKYARRRLFRHAALGVLTSLVVLVAYAAGGSLGVGVLFVVAGIWSGVRR